MMTSLLVALGLGALGAPGSFADALSAEVRALSAEKAALESALSDARETSRAAEAAVREDIERLTARLARARAKNAARAGKSSGGERTVALEQAHRRLDRLKSQARAWLEARGATVAADAGPAALVEAGLGWVRARGSLRVHPAEYFTADGRAAFGPVLHVGRVGALLADGLAPLGRAEDGSLRRHPAERPAPRLAPTASVASVLLQDPRDPSALVTSEDDGLLAWLTRGGPIMGPLAALGLLAAAIGLERALALARASAETRRIERRGPRPGSPLGAPIFAARAAGEPRAEVEARVIEALEGLRGRLRRGLFFLAVIASAAPLIGLLGTVTGMIGTFAVITEHGTGDPRLLSAGISEALLTTQLGLMVAVPALLASALLGRLAERVLGRIESLASASLEPREEAPC
jgi:biopolymer transport protein ExbB